MCKYFYSVKETSERYFKMGMDIMWACAERTFDLLRGGDKYDSLELELEWNIFFQEIAGMLGIFSALLCLKKNSHRAPKPYGQLAHLPSIDWFSRNLPK